VRQSATLQAHGPPDAAGFEATPALAHSAGPWRDRARALLFLAVAVGGVLAVLVPSIGRLVPACAFHSLTGLYCPGCGTARAMRALVQGDLATALRMNAFTVVAITPVLLAITRDVLESFGVMVWPRLRWHHAWAWALLAFVLVFWVLRNIPVEPFTWLAPF